MISIPLWLFIILAIIAGTFAIIIIIYSTLLIVARLGIRAYEKEIIREREKAKEVPEEIERPETMLF